MMLLIKKFVFIIIITIVNTEYTENHPDKIFQIVRENLKWTCSTLGHCNRLQLNATAKENEKLYDTKNICRLTCGSFGALWPRPTGTVILTKQLSSFHPDNVKFNIQSDTDEILNYLNRVSEIFIDTIKTECTESSCTQDSDVIIEIIIQIVSQSLEHTWETDESYTIDISPVNDNRISITIKAETVYGIRHGLETISQLITGTPDPQDTNILNGLVIVSSGRIRDRPIYAHRGITMDTARHFYPVRSLEKMLDGMAASKMNVFHWHATDSQSWPLEILRVPHMAKYGAYSSSEIYKRQDIEHIFQYAKERGIRVILEMDAPAHSGNGWQWGKKLGLGDLAVCVNQQPWRDYCIQPPCGQLNPANLKLYSVLRNIYKDFSEIIPSGEAFHMGGDELFFNCWNTSTEILKFMSDRGLGRDESDFLQLWAEYQAASLRIWDEETGRGDSCSRSTECHQPTKIILWSSHLTEPATIEKYLEKDRYIIQTWVESNNQLSTELLNKGYQLIISTKNAWYLDHGFWGITSYYAWREVYRNRLQRHPGVLGGEVCLWSELIDEQSLDSRVWPRAAAAAERLWSDPDVDARYAETRFYRHRQRLLDRGLKPEAVAPQWCLLNDGDCV